MSISGNNFQIGRKRSVYSYYFSHYSHIWGWASWRRAWEKYDRDMKSWPEFRDNGYLQDIANGDEAFLAYWNKIFDLTHAGSLDTWDYQFLNACWANGGLAVLPSVNLVSNIGFGEQATHEIPIDFPLIDLPRHAMRFPLKHPPNVVRDIEADRFTESLVYQIKNEYSVVSSDKGGLLSLFSRFAGLIQRR
ncbi:hypothetical protein ACFL0S_02580 [Thermodesulfobacteriota bacterium]